MRLLTFTIALGFSAICGERFGNEFSGEFRGFTKSPIEHIIVRIDKPFEVRSIRGVLLSEGGEWPERIEVLFEIRGPDDSEKIKGTRGDRHGQFRINNVRPGKYAFKATAPGWQSCVGTVTVTKKARPDARIRIVMPLGV